MQVFRAGTKVDEDLFIEVFGPGWSPEDIDLVVFTLFFEHPVTGEFVEMKTYEPKHVGEGRYLAVVTIPKKTPPGSYFLRWSLVDEGEAAFAVHVDQKFRVLPPREKTESKGG
jgi:hypothetical protein